MKNAAKPARPAAGQVKAAGTMPDAAVTGNSTIGNVP